MVENTHNFGGGTVQPLDADPRAARRDPARGVAMHLDGARLWNAHVATGIALATYGAQFDTVSGLPVARASARRSARCSSARAEQMAEARIWRKRYGGGMRQAGILAAAGLYALDHHVDRLADDHARARRFARGVRRGGAGVVDPATVETNIVVLDVGAAGWTAPEFVAAAARAGRAHVRRGRPVGARWCGTSTSTTRARMPRSTPRAPCSARARPETSDCSAGVDTRLDVEDVAVRVGEPHPAGVPAHRRDAVVPADAGGVEGLERHPFVA